MKTKVTNFILLCLLALSFDVSASPLTRIFKKEAAKSDIDPNVLEGICRYESASGVFKQHRNRNGTWDVGFCQNHRYTKGVLPPNIPSNSQSISEAAKELKYWRKQHKHFCVHTLKLTGKCGYNKYGKFRGIKNCKRPHPWWQHYNHGFRVLTNNYGKKVQCAINNKFKRCKEKQWSKLNF